MVLSAALKKGDPGDILVLANGTELPLPVVLPHPEGTTLVVEVLTPHQQQLNQQELARQILQDILDGR